jgi:hypothetical protein
MIGLTERKIGLHDLLGKTRVLDGTPPGLSCPN